MENLFYELFAASIQDGYIGNLIDIVNAAGGEKRLYDMTEADLEDKLMLTPKMAEHIINRRNCFDYDKTIKIMADNSIDFVRYSDKKYPARLRRIQSRPYGLFIKGSLPGDEVPSVAIVGARNCSQYGRLMAEYFGDRLARHKVNVISGMAYGIDGISQMAAIDAGGSSYGILGCGVDIVYPASNRRLYERLVKNGGVISEYLPGTGALARNFPPRNRIISGLCDVLLVVEARAKSGTLITVDLAIEQNKEVMVVPGRITDPLSVGCLNLMKAGASPALCIEDVLEELNNPPEKVSAKADDFSEGELKAEELEEIKRKKEIIKNAFKNKPEKTKKEGIPLSEEEERVYRAMDYYPKNIEAIARESSLPVTRVLAAATSLELKGLINALSQSTFLKNS